MINLVVTCITSQATLFTIYINTNLMQTELTGIFAFIYSYVARITPGNKTPENSNKKMRYIILLIR